MKLPRTVQLALFASLLLFWNLGYAPFLNPDEGRYTSAAYEMAFGLNGDFGSWLIPHLDGVTRLNKPPLVYWMTALVFKAFGVSAWSGRIPQALVSLGILALLWVWASRVWDRRAAAFTTIIWATAAFPAAMERVANTDMILAGAIALASFGGFWTLEASTKKGRTWAIVALGVGMGLALLAKGPVGMALPMVGVGIYAALSRTPLDNRRLSAFGLGLGLALLIGLPWYIAVEVQRPGFIHEFIFSENLKRFGGGENFHKKTSPFYYLPVLLGGLVPWASFLILAVSQRLSDGRARRTRLFLWIWAVGIGLFFSASNTKLMSYVLPAFPALSLLVGAALSEWSRTAPRLRAASIGVALLLNLAVMIALTGYPKRDKVTKTWDMRPGYLLDEKTLPREEGVLWLWAMGATLTVQSVGWLWCLRRPDVRTLAVVGANNAVLLIVVLLQVGGRVAAYEDGSGPIVAALPFLAPNEKLVCFRSFLPSAITQAGQPVYFANFKNTSGLNPFEIKNNPRFPPLLNSQQLLEWLKKPEQKTGAVIVVESSLEPEIASKLSLWGRNNDFFMYGTRSKPERLDFNLVAPLKQERPPKPNYVPGEDLPGSNQ